MPGTAAADTFCVKHAGCTASGHNFTTIGAALTAAASNGSATLDTIEIGPGTYDEDLTDAAGNPVNIAGSGDSTDIAPSTSTSNQQVLSIAEGSSAVSSLKITIPAGTGNTGISVAQTIGAHGPSFSHVDVVENPTATNATGAALYGSSFTDGSVRLTDADSHAAFLTDSSLSGSTVVGDQAVGLATTATQQSSVVRSRVTGTDIGIFVDGATRALIADDLIVLTGSTGQAFLLTSGSQQAVTMDSSTLVGAGGSTTGAQVGTSLPSAPVTLNVDDTIIRGFGTDLTASGSTSDPATLNIRYSDFDPAKESLSSTGATITEGPGDLHNIDPHFVAPSDFELAPGSPIIDKGDPAAPSAGEPVVDLGGFRRKVDGDHSGVATIDMGAFEFQPRDLAPVASFTAPRTAVKGKPVKFNGTGSHDPDGDPITFAWQFGDGGRSTLAKPVHTYAKAGTYRVELFVTDDFGASTKAVRTIAVSGPPCKVPTLAGRTLAAAKRALKNAHCAVGKITHKDSKRVKRGRVISSNPKAGSELRNGARVALTVSRGRS